MDEKLKELTYKYAVKNAFEHEGKASMKAVIGKLMALDKGLAKNLSKEVKEINEIIERVNSMDGKEIESEFNKFLGSFELKPAPAREGLGELDWAKEGEINTRFAPNPNGPFHLGNARAALMSYEYSRKYKGKFILRFDDTDPKVKRPIEKPEKIFLEDLGWLGIKVDEVYFASDRIELYYQYMRKILSMNKAYVCSCEKGEWKKKIDEKKGCECRELKAEEQSKRFEKMISNEFKEGEAVLRIKTDLNEADPSLRDWWAAKIMDEPFHPRTGDKYHVWPSYNFASAIDDHEMNITLIIRGQEHAQNAEKQKYLYSYFGWTYPHAIHTGRIALEGIILSTSETRKGIEEGKYIGWDDPRLGTIKALRRRGFHAKALIEALKEVGVKTNDTTITRKHLIALNKKHIDPIAERFTFIDDPIRFDVQYIPAMEIERFIHPDYPEQGSRVYELKGGTETVIVSKKEIDGVKEGEIVRLRHGFNARIIRKDSMQVFAEYVSTGKLKGKPILSWILEETDAMLFMPSTERKYGSIEAEAVKKEKGSFVQLEKTGYGVIDSIERGKVNIWFTHE
ncbi:MAG: glutamate--tRNA ligase [archaeon]